MIIMQVFFEDEVSLHAVNSDSILLILFLVYL